MIKIYKRLRLKEKLNVLEDIEEDCLIDVFEPTEEELEFICNKIRINKESLKDILKREKASVGVRKGFTFVIFAFPFETNIDYVYFIFRGRYLLIFRRKDIKQISELIKEGSFITKKRVELLLKILDKIVVSFTDKVMEIGKVKSEKEKVLFKTFDNKFLEDLLEINEIFIKFSSAIIENRKVIEEISSGNYLKVFEDDKIELDELKIDLEEASKLIDLYINTLSSTLDAMVSIVSNNLSNVVKILTSLTVILMLPTLIASYYGMNVSLPIQENPYAFHIIILLSVLISLLAFKLFKKYNWI